MHKFMGSPCDICDMHTLCIVNQIRGKNQSKFHDRWHQEYLRWIELMNKGIETVLKSVFLRDEDGVINIWDILQAMVHCFQDEYNSW